MDILRTTTLQSTLTAALHSLRNRLSSHVAVGKVAVIVTDFVGNTEFNLTLDGTESPFSFGNELSRFIELLPIDTHNQRVCALEVIAAATYAIANDANLSVNVTYQVNVLGGQVKDFVVQQYQDASGKLVVTTPVVLDQSSAE
jgi:hypothetical protein